MIRETLFNPSTNNGLKQTKQKGFTLIELIMVIVILGILSAFALPRFADFTGDAERSSVEGARASVRSASAIAHAACLASSGCNASASSGETVTIEGEVVDMVFGYPAQADISGVSGLNDYTTTDATGAGYVIVSDSAADGSPCFTYTESAAVNTLPTISVLDTYDDNTGGAASTHTCP